MKARRLVESVLMMLILVFIFGGNMAYAQRPQDLPYNTDPVNFDSIGNVFFYIGIPVLLIVFYIFWRRAKRKRR